MRKIAAVVALFASSLASVSAADVNGYTGLDYTFVGTGHCIPSGSTTHYSHGNVLYRPFTTDQCAAHCHSFSNAIEGQVGFDTNYNSCICRYTDGTGPVSATTEEGITYNTDASGAIGGTDGATNQNICYRRNAFRGEVSV